MYMSTYMYTQNFENLMSSWAVGLLSSKLPNVGVFSYIHCKIMIPYK